MENTKHKNGDVSIRFNLLEQHALSIMLPRLVRIYKKRRALEIVRVCGYAPHRNSERKSPLITLYNNYMRLLDDLIAKTDPLVRNGTVSRHDHTA